MQGAGAVPTLAAPNGTFYLVGYPVAGVNCFFFDLAQSGYNATKYHLDFYTEQDLMYHRETRKSAKGINPFNAAACVGDHTGITEIGRYILATAYLGNNSSHPANLTQVEPPASFDL